MGLKKELTDIERGKIDVLKATNPNWSPRKIGGVLGRSHMTIAHYLKDPAGYGHKKRTGRPQATTERERRAIVKLARRRQSAAKVRGQLPLRCNVRTVLRVIQSDPNTVFLRHRSKPPLTTRHQNERLEWAWARVGWTPAVWAKIVFSDEKKWNLDGPDGCRAY